MGGYDAHGYEINPVLLFSSRLSALRELGWRGSQHATFHGANLWNCDLGEFDVIMVFGVQEFMERMADKLKQEVQPDARIFLYRFYLPGWQPVAASGEMRMYRPRNVKCRSH